MGLLRRFEKSLEKAFEEPFAKVFKGEVHPLEVARRVLREMDEGRVLGVNDVLAPNRYLVSLSPEDYTHLEGVLETMCGEMESLVINYANRKGYHLKTRPRLEFRKDDNLGLGQFRVQASFEEAVGVGSETESAVRNVPLRAREDRLGVLNILSGELSGSSYRLNKGRVRIGRAAENDIVLADPKVSRFHAEIERIREGYVLRDLGSTNGTLIGGRRVRERLLENGDILSLGDVKMRFELNEDWRGGSGRA